MVLARCASWLWVASLLGPSAAAAGPSVPAELRPFVPHGAQVVAHEAGDLNGDGRPDALLVTEAPGDDGDGPRRLTLLVRGPNGTLQVAQHSDRVVLCRACGGALGDPFAGLTLQRHGFTVAHHGGSAWRWSTSARFAYSRIDRAWQLVAVEERSFHAAEPEKAQVQRHRPPKDFGKIDLADFDPERYLGVGPR